MAAGTATLSDSYNLSLSAVFKQRVQTEVVIYCNVVENEIPTGPTGAIPNSVHQARLNFVKTITNPSQFSTWLAQFVDAAASDANLIAAATNASVNYTPITSQAAGDTAAAEGGLITALLISNAVAAAFNTFVPGI